MAAALLGVGVILGIAGLFPAYIGAASLAQQSDQLIPHAIYLAVWAASAVLILLGGARLRLGRLLSLGLSAVTFGLFFADAGTAISAPGNSGGGAGLVLSLIGWVACAAGTVVAFLAGPGRPAVPAVPAGALARPRGSALGPVILVVLAGLGVAAAFAPSWDSFTLRTAAGQVQTVTAGNAFSNPGLVITGNVAVMVVFAAAVIAAALWRPARYGAVLLAGAAVPMAAQAISAIIQVGVTPGPAQFGIPAATGQPARDHDQRRPHARVLDLLRVPHRAGRLVRVDALHAAACPGDAGRRLRLERPAARRPGRPGAGRRPRRDTARRLDTAQAGTPEPATPRHRHAAAGARDGDGPAG